MNTGGRRSQNGRRRNRRRNLARGARPVIMVAPARNPQRPRRQRRRGRATNRTRGNAKPNIGHTFVFGKDNILGNSSGSLTFGKSLSECPAFSDGILKAYHEYKITMVTMQFVTEAASTTSGSISYELDPHCELTSLASTIDKFILRTNGRKVYNAALINGQAWRSSKEDQFRILYKGNSGKSDIAGSFRFTIRVEVHNPK